ncbi:FHA domain-containing protein PS1 [Magnolia sinica]|uniref:FHA domain-containing protein PS1 n=1 Tax=Magnolia sinica TaxID=86752 RepID=UPI00265A332F|nr:FHA domain-containing protein PS1 [Magnolia sinica]
MAEKKEKSKEEEAKIPVFTVLKNGIILKNIILNNPPPLSGSQSSNDDRENGEKPNQEDEVLLVGRHPDCHIVLDHPSISRFHLKIRSRPSSQQLSVIDLSSVHGTWISGRKIEPQVGLEMVEGDTLRLGASTRIYKLLWVPLSHAFEIEKPLISPEAVPEEKEERYQAAILKSPKKKQNDSWRLNIPSAPPMPESMNSSSPDEVSSDAKMPTKRENLNLEKDSFTAQSLFKVENKSPERRRSEQKHWAASLVAESVDSSMPDEVRFEADAQSERQDRSREVCFTTEEVLLSDTRKNGSPPIRRSEQWKKSSSLQSRRCKPVSFLSIQTGRTGEKMGEGSDAVIKLENQKENIGFEQCKKEELLCKLLFDESFQSDKENLTLMTSTGPTSKKGSLEKMGEGSDSVIETENQKENANVEQCKREELLCKAVFEESFQSDKENLTPIASAGLKSKKGTLEMMQMEFQKSSLKGEELLCKDLLEESFQSDKENLTPIASAGLKSKKGTLAMMQMEFQKSSKGEEPLCKDLLFESFKSDQENLTPLTSIGLKSKKGSLEMKQMEMHKSSSKGVVAGLDMEEDMFPSDKENLTPSLSQDSKLKKPTSKSRPRFKLDMMKKNAVRVPFQSLLESSIDKSKSVSVLNATSRNSNSISHSQTNGNNSTSSASQSVDQAVHKLGEGKKKWNMVVDTSCLLNEESRRSLKLLEGLKGTHLIIPRMVIRELDCLKRRGSRFRKANEASSILQWIEECMVKTSWWIHVQSSVESVPIAPTPPVSPRSRLSEGSNEFPGSTTNSVPFSTCGSLMEIVSPTAEDHILECALLFKRIKDDGQLVLLTNEIALKIKAMAEGLICETATEFRESLVNPCSKRFMWVESTPIGPTWSSCLDDAGLKENYRHCPPAVRKTAKVAEGAKGLKLILLHNSHYGQMNPVK